MLPLNYEQLHGWCTVEKANKLMDIIKELKPSLCVELGVFAGRSLLPIALAAQQVDPNARVIGIDAWSTDAAIEGTNDTRNADWWKTIDYANIRQYAEKVMWTNNVRVGLWTTRSADAASRFEDNSIDFLHQDSNHSEEVTCEEVELYWNKVRKGGLWAFDDTNWPTTQKAQPLLLSKGYAEIYREPKEGAWKIYVRY